MTDKNDLVKVAINELDQMHRQKCFEHGDHPDEVDTQYSALLSHCNNLRAELDAANDKLAKAVEALSLADANLTNLQPKITNGLVSQEWIPVFDGYIDPVIQAARAALTQKDTNND